MLSVFTLWLLVGEAHFGDTGGWDSGEKRIKYTGPSGGNTHKGNIIKMIIIMSGQDAGKSLWRIFVLYIWTLWLKP